MSGFRRDAIPTAVAARPDPDTLGQLNTMPFANGDAGGTVYRKAVGSPDVMPVDPPHEYDDFVLQLLGGNTDPPYNYNNAGTPITSRGFVQSDAWAANAWGPRLSTARAWPIFRSDRRTRR